MSILKDIENKKEEIYRLGDELFKHPELGYKEFTNKKILEDYFSSYGLKTIDLGFETAFKVSIGKGKPHIGLIAELDALPTKGHKFVNKKDNFAAHSCGHSTQCAIMAAALVDLKKYIKQGKITLFFTPGEEFTDIDYRKKLINEGKINYIGGKTNMLVAGTFDDIDMIIHCHTMSENKYHFSLNSSLTGFIYKEIIFKGKSSHAAVSPEKGINALNAFALFNDALGMMRETFKEDDHIRIHGILKEGGQTVNSIPERVIYECYVRSSSSKTLQEVSQKVDNMTKYCSKALGAFATIKQLPGYLPLVQSPMINDVIYKYMKKYADDNEIKKDSISMAAGDIGDLSHFIPTVQFGYSGFKGACHSKDLCVVDYNKAYLEPIKIISETSLYLLNNKDYSKKIINNFKPLISKTDYLNYLNK